MFKALKGKIPLNKKPLIILTGPTAVGKTNLSIQLAKKLNTEIISADSMQVYKEMNIGTAKITQQEMDGVTHHLIDIISPKQPFNICEFKNAALCAMDSIYAKGKVPLIVGGTGFYIKALLYDTDFDVEGDNSSIRKDLEKELALHGPEHMHNRLNQIDPQSALSIHKNNTKRVIRAIEYYLINNKPISSHNTTMNDKDSPYNFVYFVLNDDRNTLYERIEQRVDKMISEGLLDEVNMLKEMGLNENHTSMQAIGYKEILEYTDGKVSFQTAVDNLKKDTRHLAKRQLTWFRGQKEITWINRPEFKNENEILDYIMEVLNEKHIQY